MTKLGLTCISEQLKLKDKQKYSFRTMTRKRFNDLCVKDGRDEAIKELSERILHNAYATQHILAHCRDVGISHYRLSSNLCPLVTDQTLDLSLRLFPNFDIIKNELLLAGFMAEDYGISVGMHPDQFNVLASANETSVNKTIAELNFQAEIMDMMGLGQDHTCPMNIHINGTPPEIKADGVDPDSINNMRIKEMADRFYNNLMRCDAGVFNRLTIENEDKGFWNVDNIIAFSEYIFHKYNFNIPVCYDNLHDFCNPSEERNIIFQAERCAYTWIDQRQISGAFQWTLHHQEDLSSNNFLAPVFHWSEGKPDKPRSHADYFALGNFPPHIAIDPNNEVKWECEVKLKDIAIQKLIEGMELNSPTSNYHYTKGYAEGWENALDNKQQLV